MKTAVEWLAKELESYGDPKICRITWEDLDSLVNQAKAMEKKQLCYFYVKGAEAEINNPYVTNIEFYNETFKSE